MKYWFTGRCHPLTELAHREAKEKAEAKDRYMKVRISLASLPGFFGVDGNSCTSFTFKVRRMKDRRNWHVWQRLEPNERRHRRNARPKQMVGCWFFTGYTSYHLS